MKSPNTLKKINYYCEMKVRRKDLEGPVSLQAVWELLPDLITNDVVGEMKDWHFFIIADDLIPHKQLFPLLVSKYIQKLMGKNNQNDLIIGRCFKPDTINSIFSLLESHFAHFNIPNV